MSGGDGDGAPLYRSRYPDFDVLARAHEWDEVTRRVVLERVHDPPAIRFFSRGDAAALEALADVVVPQDDRPPQVRVPLVAFLDARLHAGRGRGFRYEDLPPDPELWRRIARGLDELAHERHATTFAALAADARAALFAELQEGRATPPAWRGMNQRRAVTQILTEFVMHYYAHPFAWNEIGWAGPRFPRIYPRTGRDNPEEPLPVGEEAEDAASRRA